MLEMRERRAAAKKTLKELALLVGVSECYISQIETGARRPSVPIAKRIAAALGFDWTRFYEDPEEKPGV